MVLSSLYVRGVKSALFYEHHINRKWWCQYLKSFSCVLRVVLLWWGRLGWKMEDPQLLGLIISLGWQCIYTSEVKSLSRVRLSAAPWTVAYQSPQSMEFSRQEYWSGLPFPYYRWRKRVFEMCNNLPKFIHLMNYRSGMWIHVKF